MSESNDDLWEKAKLLLKEETTVITYETWIQPLKLHSIQDNNIILIASNTFQKETAEGKYLPLLQNTFNFITNKKNNVEIILEEDVDQNNPDNMSQVKINTSYANTGLNPKYTFENFVVGSNNDHAHAAALGVCEKPGKNFNPFYIYGGVGLGKTHLIHAIGNQILKDDPTKKVLYVTSENFTNELINSLKDQSMESFRKKYRSIDVLLIDDIQFISNKKSTQEEFFHTFNVLHDAEKQIIITSDNLPKDIELLEERLKSRFVWGVISDISNPDYETRLAILRKKAQQDNIIVDDEILTLIATRINTNIRELEGILNKLIATASIMKSPITIEMAQKAIDELVKNQDKVISSEYIQEVVAKYFSISVQDLTGPKRSNDVTFPRQIAMYLCRNVAQMSMPQIGADFGKRDHTTVLHGCNKIEKEIEENSNTKLIVESVKRILLSKNN